MGVGGRERRTQIQTHTFTSSALLNLRMWQMRMYSDRTRFFQSLIVRGPAWDCDASLPWSLWIDDSMDAGAAGLDTVPAPLDPAAKLPDAAALSPLRVVRSVSNFTSMSNLCTTLAVDLAEKSNNLKKDCFSNFYSNILLITILGIL